MRVSATLRDIWKFFWFTDQHFVRDIFIRLWEVEFKYVPARVRNKLVNKAALPNTSLPVELGNGAIRKREHWHHNLTDRAKWHALATSNVLQDFDLKPPTATLSAVTARAKSIPQSTFIAAAKFDNSLGSAYDRLSGDATWDNISWEHRRLCFQSFRVFVEELKGDWKKLGNSWASTLAVRKTFIYSDHPDLAGQGYMCEFQPPSPTRQPSKIKNK